MSTLKLQSAFNWLSTIAQEGKRTALIQFGAKGHLLHAHDAELLFAKCGWDLCLEANRLLDQPYLKIWRDERNNELLIFHKDREIVVLASRYVPSAPTARGPATGANHHHHQQQQVVLGSSHNNHSSSPTLLSSSSSTASDTIEVTVQSPVSCMSNQTDAEGESDKEHDDNNNKNNSRLSLLNDSGGPNSGFHNKISTPTPDEAASTTLNKAVRLMRNSQETQLVVSKQHTDTSMNANIVATNNDVTSTALSSPSSSSATRCFAPMCIPLDPPIPGKFQGDMGKNVNIALPEFICLINYPMQSDNLPNGMRSCVMCGQACPFGGKPKKDKQLEWILRRQQQQQQQSGNVNTNNINTICHLLKPPQQQQQSTTMTAAAAASLAALSSTTTTVGSPTIPVQNKSICTACDVKVWVICESRVQIKWCKGCKNFRPWAAFGDKGSATKCTSCRERQKRKYAEQRTEKQQSNKRQK